MLSVLCLNGRLRLICSVCSAEHIISKLSFQAFQILFVLTHNRGVTNAMVTTLASPPAHPPRGSSLVRAPEGGCEGVGGWSGGLGLIRT